MSGGTAPLNFPTDDEQTRKVWSRRTEREIIPRTLLQKFIDAEVVVVLDELTGGFGDEIKYNLETLISGAGRIQNEKLSTPDTSNEVAQSFWQDKVTINQLRQAIRWYGRISEQRVAYKFRNRAKSQLTDWYGDRWENAFLSHITGDDARFLANPADVSADGLHPGLAYTGLNKPTRPTTDHTVDATTEKFNLSVLEDMVFRAKTIKDTYGHPLIRPVRVEGEELFPILVSSASWRDLRTSTTAGDWLDVQKAMLQGGFIERNPIITGAGGIINGAILYEVSRMPGIPDDVALDGSYVADQKWAVLLGKHAVVMAFGEVTPGFGRLTWDEDSYDLGNENVIGGAQLAGIKKCVFNTNDYAVLAYKVFASADKTATP